MTSADSLTVEEGRRTSILFNNGWMKPKGILTLFLIAYDVLNFSTIFKPPRPPKKKIF